MTLSPVLMAEHRDCDDRFAVLEQALRAQDWPLASSGCTQFVQATLAHFAVEESLLFPALEAASGMSRGPTTMMRHEHEQMRELMAELQTCVAAADADAAQGVADTLLVLMQQHNMKEENILYPMCDSQITDVASLLQEIRHAAA